MSKLRQILKLHKQHQGTRVISEVTQISRNSIKKYLIRFRALKSTLDEHFISILNQLILDRKRTEMKGESLSKKPSTINDEN